MPLNQPLQRTRAAPRDRCYFTASLRAEPCFDLDGAPLNGRALDGGASISTPGSKPDSVVQSDMSDAKGMTIDLNLWHGEESYDVNRPMGRTMD